MAVNKKNYKAYKKADKALNKAYEALKPLESTHQQYHRAWDAYQQAWRERNDIYRGILRVHEEEGDNQDYFYFNRIKWMRGEERYPQGRVDAALKVFSTMLFGGACGLALKVLLTEPILLLMMPASVLVPYFVVGVLIGLIIGCAVVAYGAVIKFEKNRKLELEKQTLAGPSKQEGFSKNIERLNPIYTSKDPSKNGATSNTLSTMGGGKI